MDNSYTWVIARMDAYPTHENQENVVYTVYWTLNGTDKNGHFGSLDGTVNVIYSDNDLFTPYEQLTESQVIGWVTTALGPEQVSALENNINEQIKQQIAPKSVNLSPPWSA